MLVIHGANDPRVPLSEAEQVVAAVRASGAECPLLVYPDEGHGLAKRANQLDAYPQALEFLAKHWPATGGANRVQLLAARLAGHRVLGDESHDRLGQFRPGVLLQEVAGAGDHRMLDAPAPRPAPAA